jgi:hypothetical protein
MEQGRRRPLPVHLGLDGEHHGDQRDDGGHGAHLADLINAIYEKREPISSGRDNLQTVASHLAAKRSAEEGRPVAPREMMT